MKNLMLKTMVIFFLIHIVACGSGGKNETIDSNQNEIADTTPPVITLIGDNLITIILGDEYVEKGATAIDAQDGNIAVTVTGIVDTNSIATYTINYSATDSSGNTSSATRTIIVEAPLDLVPPVISLIGESGITITQGTEYIELGASAYDENDGNVEVTITGSVNSNVIGIHIITYTAKDTADNTSSLTREVQVITNPDVFITRWKTDNEGVSENNQIMIDTIGADYDYSVNWGDGTTSENVTSDITHTYESVGTYTVTISGSFPRIHFEQRDYDWDSRTFIYHSDNGKILSVEQWGNNPWQSMEAAFIECINFNGMAVDTPNLSQTTNMSRMFKDTSSFNQNINHWDVSNITDMTEMFRSAYRFNKPLDDWDVSAVVNMESMFADAHDFNQSIASWDISSTTNLSRLFSSAWSYNQPIGSWNVSTVEDMGQMFASAYSFNQNIENWDVSAVTTMAGMFSQAKAFNQPLEDWNVSSVINMSSMFKGTESFNMSLKSWDVSNVNYMYGMFEDTKVFNQDINDWDVSSVKAMVEMFRGANQFNQSLSSWDVSSVEDFDGMFREAQSFNQPLNNWDTSSANYMSSLFLDAKSFNQNISAWNVSKVYSMVWMFDGTPLSTENYDAVLLAWSAQPVQHNVPFSALNTQYTTAAKSARDTLIHTYNWSITDAGAKP